MNEILKILILEDVRFDVELIERELMKGGVNFESLNVSSKEEFIQALDEYKPNIVLSDHRLPQFNSLDALFIFKEKKLQIPFILVTGTVSEEFAVRILKEGADDYLLKGNLTRLPSAITNALKQKRTEQEKQKALIDLQKSEEHFRSLIENSTDLITVLDNKLDFIYCSPSIKKILGYDPSELEGENLCSFIHPDDFDCCTKEFKKEITDSDPSYAVEYRFQHKNNYFVHLESTGKPGNENGDTVYIVNSRDVTESRNISRKLRSKVKELDTLIYMYSHDLKGPFCSLQGYVNIAKMEVKDENALFFINRIEATVEKLDTLLMNLVQITMINRGDLNIADISILEVVNEEAAAIKKIDNVGNFEIIKQIEVENWKIDKTLLGTILRNLLNNAFIYRKKEIADPYAEVKITITDGALQISVKDNGMGIPEEIQDEVFDIFFRGSHESKGSGLGLYIVKNAVEKLGGEIKLYSRLKEGSQFIIKIPETPSE
jgi:PAS domain S-box-containing protein